jgi:hypothetical protein
MCGLGIRLEETEQPAPQAARDFTKAILEDLESTDDKTKGKEKGGANAAEKIKRNRKRTAKPISTQDKQLPAGEEGGMDMDESSNHIEMVAENSCRIEGSEAFSNEDTIIQQAVDAEEKGDVSASFIRTLFTRTLFLHYSSTAPLLRTEQLQDTASQRFTCNAGGARCRQHLERAIRTIIYLCSQSATRHLQRRH